MKNALILFKDQKKLVDTKTLNSIIDSFAQENFNIDGIYIFSYDGKEEFEINFSKIRQAYDNVFIVESTRNKFDVAKITSTEEKEGFSLFILQEEKALEEIKQRVILKLQEKYSVKYGKVIFKVFGLEEDRITATTRLIERKVNVKFNVFGQNLDYKVEIVYDDKSTKMDFDYAQKEFIKAFKDNIYAEKDVEIEKMLVDLLKLRKCVISTCESFTGGNISAKITSVSGASSVFYEGIVSYNENSKAERLNVSKSSLAKYKPVSGQVAGEMACGLIKAGHSTVAISTTGIAGPNSDDSGFPVGLCFIGVAYNGEINVYRYVFDGSRDEIIEKGTKMAMFLAIKCIKNI